MTYLADANVLSELARESPSPRVVTWVQENEADLVANPIILGEIEYGILQIADGRKKRLLRNWFNDRVRHIAMVDMTAETGLRWAELLARLKANGTPMPIKDSLIAASALEHGLTVASRNVADFKKAGVRIINPFE